MRATCGTWRAWAALAVVLTACGSAGAFYWGEWPGSQIRAQETLITRSQQPGQPPPVVPTKDQPPPLGPPVPIDKPPVGPHPTPEPSTGLIGLLGLGALAAVRRWRSSRKS